MKNLKMKRIPQMIRKILLLCALCGFSDGLFAQLSMRDVLISVPDSVIPYLSRENRLDLLDYLDAKMIPEVTNELQGRSKLVTMGQDSLLLQLNESHTLTFYLLNASLGADSVQQIVVLNHLYYLSTKEYEQVLEFYTAQWKPLTEAECNILRQNNKRLPFSQSVLQRRDDCILNRKPAM